MFVLHASPARREYSRLPMQLVWGLSCVVAANSACAQTATPQPATPQTSAAASTRSVTIRVDARANRHAINPNIYGVAHANSEALRVLNAPLNRNGGNNTSRYNWQQNADNRANDWYYISLADDSKTPGERGDSFIERSRRAGAEPMLTIPMLGWLAKVGPNREKLPSFSVAKYGAQQKTEPGWPDIGNGLKPDGTPISGNDPSDANVPNSATFQAQWAKHLVGKWGTAGKGGLRYYILDNEPALWHGTHRDVQPVGVTMRQLVDKTIAYSAAIKKVDPKAQVVGPEEWGWTGYFYSGFDAQLGPELKWNRDAFPDRKAMGGMDALPWYLQQLRLHDEKNGGRVLDIFTVHIYPQGGEFDGADATSREMQLRRNRSTRALWDANYKDETWINDTVQLIPRMKKWARAYHTDTPIGITEYNWGAENHINGATAQADIFGIFGRENLSMAARWTTPDAATPTFKAMQMYRNYDGKNSGFGETSVRAVSPDSNEIAAFAAVRRDRALTVMVINKQLAEDAASTRIDLNLAGFKARRAAQMWQLTAKNKIERLPDAMTKANVLSADLPAQSITLFVVPAAP